MPWLLSFSPRNATSSTSETWWCDVYMYLGNSFMKELFPLPGIPLFFFGKKNRSGSGSDIILLQFERIPVSASSLLQRHRQRGSVSKLQMSFSKNDQVFNTLPLPQLFRLQSFTCLVLLWEFVIYFSPELWLCLRSEGLEENEWHPWEKSAQYPPNNTTAAIRLISQRLSNILFQYSSLISNLVCNRFWQIRCWQVVFMVDQWTSSRSIANDVLTALRYH